MKQDTRNTIKTIKDYLTDKYGSVKPEWELLLSMLADNIELYKDCKVSLKNNGLYDANTGKKNPLIASIKDIQAQIMKQIQHLGLSPYASSKIKQDIEDDSEDFIEGLTNE